VRCVVDILKSSVSLFGFGVVLRFGDFETKLEI
jgi:hypothetical protein